MKELIIKIIMSKVKDVLDKTSELDQLPELKALILEEVESWLRDKLGA